MGGFQAQAIPTCQRRRETLFEIHFHVHSLSDEALFSHRGQHEARPCQSSGS